LAHSFTREPESLTDSLEGCRVGPVESVPAHEHQTLSLAQSRQGTEELLMERAAVNDLLRVHRAAIADEIAERRAVFADGAIERRWRRCCPAQVHQPIGVHPSRRRGFSERGHPPKPLCQALFCGLRLGKLFPGADWQADRASRLGERTTDC
jgi:hypothetical protein